jgi:cytochrome c5
MIKPACSLINVSIRNLSIVFILVAFSHVIIAADNAENSESKHLYESACTQCHGLRMIEKTRDGRSGWENTVHKMVIAGTQLNADEMELVIDYLVQHYGPGSGGVMKTGSLPPDSPLQPDTSVTSENISLPEGKGKSLVKGYCRGCHDLGRIVATRRSADGWRRYTKNMLERGDVTISAENIEIIVSYLEQHFGKSDYR